jgi:hypothetical protein
MVIHMVQVLCAFNLQRNIPSLYCDEISIVSRSVLRKISAIPVSWTIDKEFKFPDKKGFSVLRKMYSKDLLDDLQQAKVCMQIYTQLLAVHRNGLRIWCLTK